jgi:hypothetical protein
VEIVHASVNICTPSDCSTNDCADRIPNSSTGTCSDCSTNAFTNGCTDSLADSCADFCADSFAADARFCEYVGGHFRPVHA